MEKMTYVNALDIAINAVESNEVKKKLGALKARILKKNSSGHKPTANQTANIGFKTAILDGMEDGKRYTVTDLTKSIDAISELSNQRVSALVSQLTEEGRVAREEIKRRAYFTKITE